MTAYAALLRGINLGNHNKVPMTELRRLFDELGHTGVRSHLQSGNVVFGAASDDVPGLAAAIEERLARELGVTATVLLRTAGELDRIVGGNPFLTSEDDHTRLHVTFLADTPAPERVSALATPAGSVDELRTAGREVYLYCPNGYGRTKLNNAFLERRLGAPATTRNWRTVVRLRELTNT